MERDWNREWEREKGGKGRGRVRVGAVERERMGERGEGEGICIHLSLFNRPMVSCTAKLVEPQTSGI